MKQLLKPGTVPRAKASDYDTALALLTSVNDPKATKKFLAELQDSTLAHDAAREAAEATMAAATKRDQMAKQAEADATRQRQLLADETAAARDELGAREVAVADRENLVAAAEKSQEARDRELERREQHLREAGVRGF